MINRILSSIILIPMALFFIIKGSFYFNFFIFICFLVTAYEWYQMNKKNINFYSGLFFLIFSFYTVYLFRNVNEDLVLFILVLITCITTDIGGYIFGKIFKGPKLTKISPNKTYAGMFGGFFSSIISANFFLYYAPSEIELAGKMSLEVFVFVILISLVSQIGDLIISYFKRLSKVKNTGKIIPGHGGLLDRIDGMIFAFPFTYFYFYI